MQEFERKNSVWRVLPFYVYSYKFIDFELKISKIHVIFELFFIKDVKNGGIFKMTVTEKNNDIIINGASCFDLRLSVFCGQAFRWNEKEGIIHGVVGRTRINAVQNENGIVFKNTDRETFDKIIEPYFDLSRDYDKILSRFDDKYIEQAYKEYYGIRILKQDEWEALCSFIISQNNNIPRICGIVSRLCENFGEPLGEDDYSFPSYERLASLSEGDLAVLRAGFRAKYILDAAKKLSSGEVSIERIRHLPIEEAREELMKIKGVGKKVAECTLLYGFGRLDAFPVDVWVKRILSELYDGEFPSCADGYRGVAQQYLFHWRRNNG